MVVRRASSRELDRRVRSGHHPQFGWTRRDSGPDLIGGAPTNRVRTRRRSEGGFFIDFEP
jgi:hypothetical protein